YADGVDTGLVVAAAVDIHQLFEQRKHRAALAGKPVEDHSFAAVTVRHHGSMLRETMSTDGKGSPMIMTIAARAAARRNSHADRAFDHPQEDSHACIEIDNLGRFPRRTGARPLHRGG